VYFQAIDRTESLLQSFFLQGPP